eukprot:1192069-Prorocentrum_minimum.AAC.1
MEHSMERYRTAHDTSTAEISTPSAVCGTHGSHPVEGGAGGRWDTGAGESGADPLPAQPPRRGADVVGSTASGSASGGSDSGSDGGQSDCWGAAIVDIACTANGRPRSRPGIPGTLPPFHQRVIHQGVGVGERRGSDTGPALANGKSHGDTGRLVPAAASAAVRVSAPGDTTNHPVEADGAPAAAGPVAGTVAGGDGRLARCPEQPAADPTATSEVKTDPTVKSESDPPLPAACPAAATPAEEPTAGGQAGEPWLGAEASAPSLSDWGRRPQRAAAKVGEKRRMEAELAFKGGPGEWAKGGTVAGSSSGQRVASRRIVPERIFPGRVVASEGGQEGAAWGGGRSDSDPRLEEPVRRPPPT